MDFEKFNQNLKTLREQYTFEGDKKETFKLEKRVRKLLSHKDLKDMDGIKDFLGELSQRVSDISTLLSMDQEMTAQDRDKNFARREAYIWVLSFFVEPEKVIASILKQVDEDVKNLIK